VPARTVDSDVGSWSESPHSCPVKVLFPDAAIYVGALGSPARAPCVRHLDFL